MAYVNTLDNGFVWDDKAIIVNNPMIRDIANMPAFFVSEDVLSPGDSTGYYRPLSRMSYLFDYLLWGTNPRGYHLTNVLLHLAAAAAFYVLGVILFTWRVAFPAGLIFALHPMNVEAVAWISSRNNILAGLFIVLSLLFYVLFDREKAGSRRRYYYLTSVLCSLLALFSKEFGLLMPLVIVLYHLCFSRVREEGGERRSFLFYAKRLAPYGAGIALYLGMRSIVIGFPVVGAIASGIIQKLALSLKIYFTYIQVLLFPVGLKATYFIPSQEPYFNVRGVLSIFVMMAVAIGLVMAYRRSKGIFFGMAYMLLFLAPVSNIVTFSSVPVQERYAYLASMGFSLFIVLTAAHVLNLHRYRMAALLSLLMVCYGYQTISRNSDWKDDLTISLRTAEAMPDSPVAHDYLGNAYRERGMLREAVVELKRSTELNAGYPHAHLSLANLYLEAGMKEEAVAEYETAVRMMPENTDARFNLALIYYDKGRLDDALFQLKEVVRYRPTDAEAHNNLSVLYRQKGLAAEAEREAALAAELTGSRER